MAPMDFSQMSLDTLYVLKHTYSNTLNYFNSFSSTVSLNISMPTIYEHLESIFALYWIVWLSALWSALSSLTRSKQMLCYCVSYWVSRKSLGNTIFEYKEKLYNSHICDVWHILTCLLHLNVCCENLWRLIFEGVICS